MQHKTLFISDLHLHESQPLATSHFLTLLNQCDSHVDALYILGDFFEAWIGDDDLTPFHTRIIKALKSATERGLKIYFLHGNRDFLIGKRFFTLTGCMPLKEEEKIELYGTPVLLMHGDTLCTQDAAYLKQRKIFHNRFIQYLFLYMPLAFRKKIASKIRGLSEKQVQQLSPSIMDVTPDAVKQVMQKHHVHYLIHGHTHQPAFHAIKLDEKTGTRIVLGAWHDRGNMLVWHATGEKEWIEI